MSGGNLRVDKLSTQGRNWGRRLHHVHRPRYGNFTARHVVKRAEQPLIFGGGRGEAIGHLLRCGRIERIEGPENDAGIFRRGGALAVATGDNKWRKIGGRHAKLQLRGGSGRNHFLAGREHQKSRRNRNFKSLLGGTHIRLSKCADGRLPMGEGCEVGDVKARRRSGHGRPTAGIRLKIVIKNNRVRVARFPGIFEGDAFRCTRVTSDGLDLLPIDAKNQVSDPDGISRGQGDIEIGQRAIADVYELIANTHVDICSRRRCCRCGRNGPGRCDRQGRCGNFADGIVSRSVLKTGPYGNGAAGEKCDEKQDGAADWGARAQETILAAGRSGVKASQTRGVDTKSDSNGCRRSLSMPIFLQAFGQFVWLGGGKLRAVLAAAHSPLMDEGVTARVVITAHDDVVGLGISGAAIDFGNQFNLAESRVL